MTSIALSSKETEKERTSTHTCLNFNLPFPGYAIDTLGLTAIEGMRSQFRYFEILVSYCFKFKDSHGWCVQLTFGCREPPAALQALPPFLSESVGRPLPHLSHARETLALGRAWLSFPPSQSSNPPPARQPARCGGSFRHINTLFCRTGRVPCGAGCFRAGLGAGRGRPEESECSLVEACPSLLRGRAPRSQALRLCPRRARRARGIHSTPARRGRLVLLRSECILRAP